MGCRNNATHLLDQRLVADWDVTHPPPPKTYTKYDRFMKIQEVFYSLWLYLFIFIFIILQKESTFREFIRFDSHKTMQMKP